MLTLTVILCVVLAALVASAVAVYTYGRFARHARGEPSWALPVTTGETILDRLIEPLLAERPGQAGLVLLVQSLDAFAARADTARSAGRSLDLQYYIWENDITGQLLAYELLQAADRGVRVRLLLDDINARHDAIYLAFDKHPNIELRLFNPSRNREDVFWRGLEMALRAFRATRRMHNKAWIADGRVAIVGGRNVGDAYFGLDEALTFHDMDLATVGPPVETAQRIFDAFWNSKAVIPISALRKSRRADLPRLRRRLEQAAASDQARQYLDCLAASAREAGPAVATRPIHWTGKAEMISDPPSKVVGDGAKEWLMERLMPILSSARQRLEIFSPYFIPGDSGTERFLSLVAQGATVSVLTNSLAATDVAAVHGAYIRYRRRLVEGGVKLFELKPHGRPRRGILKLRSNRASLHTKAFTVDDSTGFVGSMNFDPRSISLNTEMGILFEHDELAAELRAVFSESCSPANSYRLAWEDGRLVWKDGSSAGSRVLTSEPGAQLSRRLLAAFIRFMPVESQL